MDSWNLEIETLPEVSGPRPQPPELETKTKALVTRSRDIPKPVKMGNRNLRICIAALRSRAHSSRRYVGWEDCRKL